MICTQDDLRLLKYSPYVHSHPSTLKKSFAVGKLYSRINPILGYQNPTVSSIGHLVSWLLDIAETQSK